MNGDTMRLLIQGGTLVTGAGQRPADLVCAEGRIEALLEPGEQGGRACDERIDAGGLLIFPGFIDPHVHSRDPGQTHKETFGHTTLAAAASGVTTMLEMPNALPPVTTAALFKDRAAAHSAHAWTDFGLWGQAIGPTNTGELPALFAAGAVAVKLFWGYALEAASGRLVYMAGDAEASSQIPPPDDEAVLEMFEVIAAAGGLLAAHCEDRQLLDRIQTVRRGAISDYSDLLRERPAVAELAAVEVAVELAARTGCAFHIVHTSAAETVEAVRRARARGLPVTAEACPHYLTLTQEDYAKHGPAMKVYPPIRSRRDQEALWEGLGEGTISSVGSDHAPHAAEENSLPLRQRPAGMHGVQTMVPLMLDAMHHGRISPQRLAEVLSTDTARLYGLGHRKGSIAPGMDADLTLVDPEREHRITAADLRTLHPVSVFDGRQGRGAAVASVLRGRVLMREGELVEDAPRGELVRARHTPGCGDRP